jgi:membrane protease YdiL (CAAX protease family)
MITVWDELLKFDPTLPSASGQHLIVATLAILVLTTLIFRVSLIFFPDTIKDNVVDDKKLEYKELKRKKVNPQTLIFGELLNGSILPSLQEELLFRFVLLKLVLFRGLKMNIHLANFLQAIIFGSCHMGNAIYSEQTTRISFIQSISASITGLICGYSYYYTNSIIPSIAAHMINNIFASYDQVSAYKSYLRETRTNK